MKICVFFVGLLFTFAGCATSGMQTTVEHFTDLQGAQKSEYFVPGTYKYKRVGLEASAAAHGTTFIGARLGQIAMDRLVKEAALGPNELLVDMVIERGMAIHKKGVKSDSVHVVTIRGDVIELGTPPNPSLEPDWGSDLSKLGVVKLQTGEDEQTSKKKRRRGKPGP